jgi:deoxyribodipyrimidine photo-lyase
MREVPDRYSDHREIQKYFDQLRKDSLEKTFHLTWAKWLNDKNFPFQDQLEKFIEANDKHVKIPIPAAGFAAGYTQLKDFAKRIDNYKEGRDIPSVDGTSRISMFLKNGSLTPSIVMSTLKLEGEDSSGASSRSQYLKEIVWREFYYSILFHRPDVEQGSFLPQYADLGWHDDKKLFARWKEGTTGFPIVDAGMRELNQTGWMHNRVRMIVASFLTKDLLINWQWGELYFMEKLLDGDLACNNGGWQWAASTGCDPQPYFRIFNPWLQSKKFDPDGEYIRTYIPELKNIPAKALHNPDADRGSKYPAPIIRHDEQRDLALDLYKRARSR